MIKKILGLLTLVSMIACGPVRHEHGGEIVHTIQVDTDSLYNFFLGVCEQDPECAKDMMLDFLKSLGLGDL